MNLKNVFSLSCLFEIRKIFSKICVVKKTSVNDSLNIMEPELSRKGQGVTITFNGFAVKFGITYEKKIVCSQAQLQELPFIETMLTVNCAHGSQKSHLVANMTDRALLQPNNQFDFNNSKYIILAVLESTLMVEVICSNNINEVVGETMEFDITDHLIASIRASLE